jgi:hypothetical protein
MMAIVVIYTIGFFVSFALAMRWSRRNRAEIILFDSQWLVAVFCLAVCFLWPFVALSLPFIWMIGRDLESIDE